MSNPEGNSKPDTPCSVLITPVGGNWQAPLAAIRIAKPNRVVFLVSSDTEKFISDIRGNCEHAIPDVDWITTQDHESVSATLRALNIRLPDILAKWHAPWEEVHVDLTGGTKVMVAALMLATIHRARNFLYVGGEVRDRQGVGVVVGGHERPVHCFNPWDETAEEARRQIYWAFNNLQFGTAQRLAENALKMVSTENKGYLRLLLTVIRGFAAWDRFDHGGAFSILTRDRDYLEMAWTHKAGHESLIPQLRTSIARLKSLKDARADNIPTKIFLEDLLANAWRRGQFEQKYDDAVARLYRFMEGLAQNAIWETWELRTGSIPVDRLPAFSRWDDLREDARRKSKPTVEIGLARSYSLLAELGHALGAIEPRLDQKGDLGILLSKRNQSLLAHGVNPVEEKDYRALFSICLEIGGVRESDLFPFLKLPE